MQIKQGTYGASDWVYSGLNPLFTSLNEKKAYDAPGGGQIGWYALNYGAPEHVFIFPNIAYASLGYNVTRVGMNIEGGTQDESKAFRQSIVTSTKTCSFTNYKWAIARQYGRQQGKNYTTFTIYINRNGTIVPISWEDTGANNWKSIYWSSANKCYYYGSGRGNTLSLYEFGQSYNSEYNLVTFDCVDLDLTDPGYAKMVAYLSGDNPYPSDKPEPSDDPYNQLDPSTPGGGTGGGRIYNIIDEPILPTKSVINTGFISMYEINDVALKSLASELWTTNFFDQIIKNFQDPFDALLSLSIFPVSAPTESDGTLIKIGNYPTNVSAHKLSSQYSSVDLGSVSIDEDIGSYMDYAPYTKLTLFLPYIGFVTLNTDDFMNSELSVKYHIDYLTGACVAYLFKNGFVHSQYTGNVANQIPLSGRDMSSLYQSMLNVGLSGIATVATGGLASALSAGALAASASTVMNSKDRVKVGGAIQGSSGFLGVQKPYVIVESPNYCVPSGQSHYSGYPAYMTTTLGSLSGYTEVDTIHLEGIPCTSSELNEIETLLKGGVIL